MRLKGIRVKLGPIYNNWWLRFNPITHEITDSVFVPLYSLNQIWSPTNPREASPTGKSGMGIAMYSMPPQNVAGLRQKTVVAVQPNPDQFRSGLLLNTGYIDPYLAQVGKLDMPLNMKRSG